MVLKVSPSAPAPHPHPWHQYQPGNLLEMQILGPYSKMTEAETLEVGPSNLWLPQAFPSDSDAQ